MLLYFCGFMTYEYNQHLWDKILISMVTKQPQITDNKNFQVTSTMILLR